MKEARSRCVASCVSRCGDRLVGQRLDYALALLARYVAGIGDLADRNFIRCRYQGGAPRVFSLDEDGRADHEVCLGAELRKNKATLVRKWLSDHWSEVGRAVRAWTGVEALAGAAGAERWRRASARDEALALFAAS